MYVGSQTGYSITVFKIDTESGKLEYLPDQTIGVQAPIVVCFASCVNASCTAVAV
jgi:6-phosphogluconolactonase (cycloisomerase 2 family)